MSHGKPLYLGLLCLCVQSRNQLVIQLVNNTSYFNGCGRITINKIKWTKAGVSQASFDGAAIHNHSKWAGGGRKYKIIQQGSSVETTNAVLWNTHILRLWCLASPRLIARPSPPPPFPPSPPRCGKRSLLQHSKTPPSVWFQSPVTKKPRGGWARRRSTCTLLTPPPPPPPPQPSAPKQAGCCSQEPWTALGVGGVLWFSWPWHGAAPFCWWRPGSQSWCWPLSNGSGTSRTAGSRGECPSAGWCLASGRCDKSHTPLWLVGRRRRVESTR